MRRLLSLTLVLVMCWSMVYVLIPVREASAVETGTAALKGERYTVDWVIPEIKTDTKVVSDTGIGGLDSLSGLSYEVLGYVSPKYPDSHATDKVYEGDELISGGAELLDGTKGTNHFLNDPWVGIYGDEDNGLLIDLGASEHTNLSTVTLNFLSDPELGIFLPSKITVATSADGSTFNLVGCVDPNEDVTGELSASMVGSNGVTSDYYVPTEYASVCYDVSITPGKLFSGQYMLLVFEHDKGNDGFVRNWTFLSEIGVSTSGEAQMPTFSDQIEAITVYDKPTDDSAYDVNVALNSTYQIIGALGGGRFSDTNRTELTDGVNGNGNIETDSEYISVTPSSSEFAVQINLGNVTDNINAFTLSGVGGSSTDYAVPSAVKLYGSEDGDTYYSVDVSAITPSQNGSAYSLSFTLSDSAKAFTARYLTFVFTASTTVAIDEFTVVTTNKAEIKENVALDATYKYLLKTAGSASFNDDYWTGAKSVSDLPALDTYGTGDLNNGISATGTFIDPAWVGYNYVASTGDYVDIVFDLGKSVKGINSVNFKLLEYTSTSTTTNCSVPDKFTVFYSDNEGSFSTVASAVGTKTDTLVVNPTLNRKQIYYTYTATPNSVTARYIMVRIPKDKKELHIDEIQIWTGTLDQTTTEEPEYETINYLGFGTDAKNVAMSGVWFDCFTITDLYLEQGTYQVDEQTYRARVSNYLTAMVEGGINTIMLHARSHGDALYGDYTFDSVSPYSKRYTGSTVAISTYDAFEVFLDMAHEVGLSVHAWVNPLRIGYASDLDTYDDKYAVKKIYNGTYQGETHGDFVGKSSDNLYWLNIGYESVRLHIIDTVMEIVNNYDVDGIIMDDYFYPSGATTAFDSECAEAYRSANNISDTSFNLGNWRRENTNMLVRALYKRIKNAKSDVLFGISPAGNITDYENSYNYTTMYADVRKWCQETWTDSDEVTYKYMDYISPQLYWAPESQFASVSRYRWNRNNYVISGYLGDWCAFDYDHDNDGYNDVNLVVSLGLYQNFEDSVDSAYISDNVVYDQLELMRKYLLDKTRSYNPVNSSGQGISPVFGQILYRSHNLYDDLSKNVLEDPSGWATNDVLTDLRNKEIRDQLKAYWQGTLTPKASSASEE